MKANAKTNAAVNTMAVNFTINAENISALNVANSGAEVRA